MAKRPTAPLTADRHLLVLRHAHQAKAMARQRARRFGYLSEDLQGAALLALVTAAARFDPVRGVDFGAWAHLYVDLGLRLFLQNQRPRGYRKSAESPGCELHPEIDLAELEGRVLLTEPDRPVGHQLEDSEAIRAALRPLNELERRALVGRYMLDRPFYAVARQLRLSGPGLHNTLIAAAEKARGTGA